jgi:hypothetical protein
MRAIRQNIRLLRALRVIEARVDTISLIYNILSQRRIFLSDLANMRFLR